MGCRQHSGGQIISRVGQYTRWGLVVIGREGGGGDIMWRVGLCGDRCTSVASFYMNSCVVPIIKSKLAIACSRNGTELEGGRWGAVFKIEALI